MFCTSLRRRSSFAAAVQPLSKAPLNLRETQLNTHDAEVAFGDVQDPRTGNTSLARQLRVLLFSRSAVSDAKLHDTFQRIQHFASLTGGEDLIIIFLLNPPMGSSFVSAKELTNDPNDVAEAEAITAYSKLQAQLIDRSEVPYIPVRPILKLDDLPEAIEKHVSSIKGTTQKRMLPTKSIELLSLCTVNPPMSEQTVYFLSDIFADMNELASTCLTISSAPGSSSPTARAALFQSSRISDIDFDYVTSTQTSKRSPATKLKRLRDLVGEQECQDIIDFWKHEWLV